MRIFAAIAAILCLLPSLAYCEIKEADDLQRDKTGISISKDLKRELPPEQKMFHVAGNVIRAEDYTQYLDRRMTALEEKLDQRFDRLEARIEELRKKDPA